MTCYSFKPMKLLGATLVLVAVSSSAFADDTKMRIMEVQLGGTTHADTQYVELTDPGESFSMTYNFVVYDKSGTSIAAQSLPLMSGTTRVMMANSSAQDEYHLKPGTNDDVVVMNLQSTLPADGSVCFRRQDSGASPSAAADEAGTRIHCMGWGNASKFPVSLGGTEHGDAPPAGMSLQKLASCLQVDPPTPNRASKQPCELRVDKPPVPVDAAPEVDAAAPIDAPPAQEGPKAGEPKAGPAATTDPEALRGTPPRSTNPPDPLKTKGCSAGGDGSWFGVVLVGLAIGFRRKRYAIANL